MNIPTSYAITEVPNPIPEGKFIVKCPRCESIFLVPTDAGFTDGCLCETCAAMPVSAGSAEAAAAVATALGK